VFHFGTPSASIIALARDSVLAKTGSSGGQRKLYGLGSRDFGLGGVLSAGECLPLRQGGSPGTQQGVRASVSPPRQVPASKPGVSVRAIFWPNRLARLGRRHRPAIAVPTSSIASGKRRTNLAPRRAFPQLTSANGGVR